MPSNSSEIAGLTEDASPRRKGLRFWLVFLAVCVSFFLSALDFSAVSTALPVIIDDLQGKEFAWVGTSYALASTAFLPLTGGLAQIFGRRSSFVGALTVFALGSALCGAAKSMNWLIAARTIQGVGGGAILSLSSIVVSDMVALRERGTYNGLIGMTWAVALSIGPLVGGSFAENGAWRWLFYLNLPISGVALVLVILFMKLPTPIGTLKEKLSGMDWIGNALVISSSTSLVIALTWGGVRYEWSSVRVIVPLVLGILGLVAWLNYEIRVASHPMVPKQLLANRTSVSGYIQIFFTSLGAVGSIYYIPTYFQACKDASPIRSSVDMFAMTMVVGPVVVMSGVSVSVFNRYRPQLWIGWIVVVIGLGVFSTIGATTPTGRAIGLEVIASIGFGFLFPATYFPVLSPLPVTENAHALALFTFVRAFAQIWGISIGSAILTNQLKKKLPQELLSKIPGGVDLVYAVIPQIRNLEPPLKAEVQEAFAESLRPVWYMLTGILGLGLLASLLMKNIPLHNYLDEKWALREEDTGVDREAISMD